MPQVLSGFATIAIVIAIGFFVGKANLLGKHAQFTLQMYVYFLATPALLLDKLYVTDPLDVLGPQLAVASGSSTAPFTSPRSAAWPAPTATPLTWGYPSPPTSSAIAQWSCRRFCSK